MAIYEINGSRYELPDDIQGEELEEVLGLPMAATASTICTRLRAAFPTNSPVSSSSTKVHRTYSPKSEGMPWQPNQGDTVAPSL